MSSHRAMQYALYTIGSSAKFSNSVCKLQLFSFQTKDLSAHCQAVNVKITYDILSQTTNFLLKPFFKVIVSVCSNANNLLMLIYFFVFFYCCVLDINDVS